MLAVDIHTRRIAGFAAHAGDVNGVIACRLLNQILGGRSPPASISTDHDPIFRHHRWHANLRVLDIDEVKTVPYTPLSHPFVERTIGTVRTEFLEQTLFWNESDLSRKLAQYKTYYNEFRGHLSLGGKTPVQIAQKACVPKQPIHNYSWISHCNNLFHTPMASQSQISQGTRDLCPGCREI